MTASESTTPAKDERYRSERRQARIQALQFLYQLDSAPDTAIDATSALDSFWAQQERLAEEEGTPTDSRSKKLAARLISGVADRRPELDRALQRYAEHWSLERMNVIDRNILRIAAFEILHCDDIPPKATTNEAIEIAKQFGDKDSPRFVNGILDRFVNREGADTES